MNLQHARIAELCIQLKLERIAADWAHLAQQSADEQASFADFLEKILSGEHQAKLERSRSTLLKMATLPAVKTLEQYDFAFASGAPRAQIQELANRGCQKFRVQGGLNISVQAERIGLRKG